MDAVDCSCCVGIVVDGERAGSYGARLSVAIAPPPRATGTSLGHASAASFSADLLSLVESQAI